MAEISTKPYLIRALYEWCADNGYRPYIAVAVDERTQVPREFVRNGEIVLNISSAATNRLSIGNELLEFEARFGGVARQVSIPIENVSAIFAQENGHGMAFEVPKAPGGEATPGAEGPREQGAAAAEGVPGDEVASPADVPGSRDAGATAGPAPGRSRRRPKLASVPASGEAPKPARRKGSISAVPAPASDAGAPIRAGAAGAERDGTTAPASEPDNGPGDDGPGPATTPPGRPHLTRVK